jgi:carboxymethylenebutenolidase
MPHTQHQIKTRDGLCPAHAFSPSGTGPWPAVLMYMDGVGMREALMDIGQRIADDGYYVLLPDLFYRVGFKAGDPKTLFSDPVARADLMTRVLPSANAANIMSDTETFLAHFDAQRDVKRGKIGITGYCMGGRLSLYAAGHFGNRIAGAASYHGSGMATDAPDSPHRLAPGIRAQMYIAGASEDAGFDDARNPPRAARMGSCRHAGPSSRRGRTSFRDALRAFEGDVGLMAR